MSKENNQSKIGALGSVLAFPALTGGADVISIARRNGGLGKNSKVGEEMATFKNFITNAQNPADVKDVFSRGISLSDNYETYKSAYKKAAKAQKSIAKGNKLPLLDKILNPVRKLLKREEVTPEMIKAGNETSIKNFKSIKEGITKGENVAQSLAQKEAIDKGVKDAVEKALKGAPEGATKEELETLAQQVTKEKTPEITSKVAKEFAQANATTMKKVGSMFKKEATNPFVLFFTALEAAPEIKDKVIPAFKEQGFKAGMKQAAVSAFKIGTNFLSFTAGSVLGKVAGSAIGAMLFPHAAAAAAILGQAGSIVAISATNAVSEKIISKVEDKAGVKKDDTQAFNAQA